MSNTTGIIWNNEMCDFTLKRTDEEVSFNLVILLFCKAKKADLDSKTQYYSTLFVITIGTGSKFCKT